MYDLLLRAPPSEKSQLSQQFPRMQWAVGVQELWLIGECSQVTLVELALLPCPQTTVCHLLDSAPSPWVSESLFFQGIHQLAEVVSLAMRLDYPYWTVSENTNAPAGSGLLPLWQPEARGDHCSTSHLGQHR